MTLRGTENSTIDLLRLSHTILYKIVQSFPSSITLSKIFWVKLDVFLNAIITQIQGFQFNLELRLHLLRASCTGKRCYK